MPPIRIITDGSRFWLRGFFVSALIHWLIIILMLWWWTSYQRSETVYQAKFCLVLDKQPVIQTVPARCEAPAPRPVVRKRIIAPPPPPPPPPPPVVIPPPQEVPVIAPPPPGEQGSLDEERLRLARAFTERLRLKIRANRDYPDQARRRGQEGTTVVGFDIIKNGNLSNIHIAKSSGYPLLDAAAMAAVTRSSPVEPIPQTIIDRLGKDTWSFTVPIVFTLKDKK